SGVAVYVGGEARPSTVTPSHPTLRLRRLRALLHLVDGDVEDAEGDAARAARLRRRWLRTAKALLGRFERDPPSILRRTILAALARALDAIVRAGACDVSDVLLVVARKVTDPAELDTLAEASMAPDLVHVLKRYADFVRGASTPGMTSRTKPHDSLLPPSVPLSEAMPNLVAKLSALEVLSRELSPDSSNRTEALRTVLVRLHTSMDAIIHGGSLRQLSSGETDGDVVAHLESALGALAQLSSGARARLDPERMSNPPGPMVPARPLSVAVSRVLAGTESTLSEHVLSASVDELVSGVPTALASIASGVIWGIADLPVDRPSIESEVPKLSEGQIPAWIPTRRTIGGFYVLRPLGGGGTGTVFIVIRLEEKGEPNPERFALKVPEYSATAARMLSEAEFSNMFRSEASALITIPHHPNLARFVTFDAGAKPKPILVMEFVEGPTLERVIESRALDVPKTVGILEDVLAGLEAMHEAGVGHLDLKPGNIVWRKQEEAVLVDFGLAGRHIRPGCATGPYGAPEVWGALPTESPTPADVYAFGCVAYESLTGKVLFDADNELAQIALHVAHDGNPPLVKSLLARPETAALGELLHSTLRREPRQRATVPQLRERLRALRPRLANLKWPIPS
ncbi:MAG TPA: serine/threonine-protein kinase, partial [Polyangiaceae bacterium]